MHHIIYLSQATREMSPMDLVALLIQARDYNEGQHITGALVYGDRQFMQVMEGERDQVEVLYARIARDPRHQNIFKLADKEIAERTFVNWSMGFREVSADDFADLTGYTSAAQWTQIEFASSSADILFLERMRDLLLLKA